MSVRLGYKLFELSSKVGGKLIFYISLTVEKLHFVNFLSYTAQKKLFWYNSKKFDGT